MEDYLPHIAGAALLVLGWLIYLTLSCRSLRHDLDWLLYIRDRELEDQRYERRVDQTAALSPPRSPLPSEPQDRVSYRRPSHSPSPEPKDEPAAIRPVAPPPAQPPSPPSPPPAVSYEPQLISQFNALAADLTEEGVDSFKRRWHPELYKASEGQVLVKTDEGKLWFVRTSGDSGVVLPSDHLVRQWDKFLRSASGLSARPFLGPTYTLEEGSRLAVRSPCLGQLQGRTVRVEQPGRLAGI
jgi:hypothetical protein